jgi:hypothetical protein
MPERPTPSRLVPWFLRACWIGVLILGGSAIDSAIAGRSEAVADVSRYGAGVVWLLGVAAMAIPAVTSLTATRALAPLSVVVAGVALSAGADSVNGWMFAAASAVTCVVAFASETARVFIQASAYGEEDRYPLKPPVSYAVAAVIAWLLWSASLIAGPLLLARQQWIAGVVVTGMAIGGSMLLWPRWHRLSKRWFVIVPIGVVIHDPIVLAETLMLRRSEIAALHLAPEASGAADLTGSAIGPAIEIITREPVTALLALPMAETRSDVIHLTACLVRPSRPGQVLTAALSRRLPVG